MPNTTGAFSELIEPGLSKVFTTDLKLAPFQAENIFNVLTSGKHTEDDLTIGGLATMPELDEGAGIGYYDPSQGYKKTYTHVGYGMGFAVTRIMWADDLYKQMAAASRKLARSAKKTFETVCANVFNNGFSTTYAGPDSAALFSATHPLLNGSSDANMPSSGVDLNLTTLENAVTEFRGFLDDTGAKLAISPRYLVVPPGEQFNAERLVGSAKDPEDASNAINPLHNKLTVKVWDYLTDADAWFLMAAPSDHQMKVYWRERPVFSSDDDFDTGNALFKATMRFVPGWSDWRGVYGSAGA